MKKKIKIFILIELLIVICNKKHASKCIFLCIYKSKASILTSILLDSGVEVVVNGQLKSTQHSYFAFERTTHISNVDKRTNSSQEMTSENGNWIMPFFL